MYAVNLRILFVGEIQSQCKNKNENKGKYNSSGTEHFFANLHKNLMVNLIAFSEVKVFNRS
jgi:hypothetical protein